MVRKKNSDEEKRSRNGANLGFEAKLWAAADELRGHMDAAEYKHVVLGLIFLKYISDAFEEKYAALLKERGADPEDRDEYLAENIFWVPKQARWGFIQGKAKEPRRVLSLMRWGLVPSWAKDISGSASMINARSETAATKPAFRDPLRFRRCLVPADAFYQWRRDGAVKQPFCFEVNDGELFAFAGLWDGWKDPGGQWVRSCSILTTTPNAVTSQVHDRIPVILSRDDYDVWLDPGMANVDAVSDLLSPFDARLMRMFPVSNRVNQVQNDDEDCSKPIEPQPQLFVS